MEISGPRVGTLTVTGGRLPSDILQLGRHFSARVLDVQANGQVQLQINNAGLQARTTLPLTAGQELELVVVQTGKQVVLKIPESFSEQQILNHALRQALPRQALLGRLLAMLQAAAHQPERLPAPLPQATVQVIRDLLQRLANPAQIGHQDGLRQAILNAGGWLEASLFSALRRQTEPPRRDFKAGLLGLFANLGDQQPTPSAKRPPAGGGAEAGLQPQASVTAHGAWEETDAAALMQRLLAETQAALARVTTQQLLSLAASGDDRQVWMVELPVQRDEETIDLFHFHFEKRSTGSKDQRQPLYRVTVAFDLAPLGPMHAQATLFDQQLTVGLWADHADTVALVNDHLGELATALEGLGLPCQPLVCSKGRPQMPETSPQAHGLLDIRA